MGVRVMSRDAAERYAMQQHTKPSYIISIKSIWDKEPPKLPQTPENKIVEVLSLSFDDMRAEDAFWLNSANGLMTRTDANLIAEFANHWYDADGDIIVHCDGGISRSAGIAAAIELWFSAETNLFRSSVKHPNMWCFTLTYDALRGVDTKPQSRLLDAEGWRLDETIPKYD